MNAPVLFIELLPTWTQNNAMKIIERCLPLMCVSKRVLLPAGRGIDDYDT